jgi:diaminohydroxyphosphoribosylaminopyrimidine deaminase/5-amino-6-(5-phosphoribosylamino)uracil reductase
MTAVGTVKADNPELTARIKCSRQPVRIIIDPDLETPVDHKVCKMPPCTVFVTRHQRQDSEKRRELHSRGIQFIEYKGLRVDLSWLMEQLGRMGLTSVLIEAGSSFNASALTAGIVDKVVFFIAPKIICGRLSIPVVGGESFFKLKDALHMSDVAIRKVGGDIMVEGYLTRSTA